MKKGVKLSPLFRGGKQERGRRAGTENVPGIVGLGVAADIARQHFADDHARIKALRDRLESGMLATIPLARINGGGDRPSAQHLQYLLRLRRRRSRAAQSRPRGRRRLLRLGLRLGLDGAEPCAARDEHPGFRPLQGAIRFSLSREST